ncbi:unnamed protein product [Mucor hiemalis]
MKNLQLEILKLNIDEDIELISDEEDVDMEEVPIKPTANTKNNSSKSRPVVSTSVADIDIAFNVIFQNDAPNVDKNNFKHGYILFTFTLNIDKEIISEQNDDKRIYSRVVKDVFHLMDMIKPYEEHGLYTEFTQLFSASLFVIDEDDKKLATEALIANGESWEMKVHPLKFSKSGRVLFDKVSWSQALSVLKTVQLGHVYDPPGVQLYYKKGKNDKYGLTLYTCVRGTNSLKGGVHQNLIKKFGFFGAGPNLLPLCWLSIACYTTSMLELSTGLDLSIRVITIPGLLSI